MIAPFAIVELTGAGRRSRCIAVAILQSTDAVIDSPLPYALSVLVVDDERDVRDLVTFALERAGCCVMAAKDGVEALERLADGFAPAVILLDLEMPRLDGEGFLRALDEQTASSPIPRVIVFTAHPFLRPKAVALCIQKPCMPSQLIDAVARVLEAA